MFGENLVSCLFSKAWNYREKGLQHLCKEVKSMLTNENLSSFPENVLSSCSQIIAMMCADPVYPVYVHAVVRMHFTDCVHLYRLLRTVCCCSLKLSS